jgi:GNAT superfamily N-acetyltransferase
MFIRSERLFLRPRWPEDAPALANLAGRGHPLDPMAAILDGVDPDDRRSVGFVVTLPGHGLVGAAALVRGSDAGELRIWIAPRWRNRGYATEAVDALAGVARMLGYGRLKAWVLLPNRSAATVLDRTGFSPCKAVDPLLIGPVSSERPNVWYQRDVPGRQRPCAGDVSSNTGTLAA